MMRYVPCVLALALGAAGCGGSAPATLSAQSTGGGTPGANPVGTMGGGAPTASTYLITISNMSFSPLDLRAPAGATVTVENKDGILHSVTSEPSPGSYTPGAPNGLTPFDTGAFSSGQRTFRVPVNAAAGTLIPYYCTVHRQTMATPTGTITVDPSAQPTTSATTPGVAPAAAPGTPTPTIMPSPGSGTGY